MAVGVPSIRHLESILTSAEINLWIAKYMTSPFGEERADLRMGILATIMATAWSGKSKRYKPADFMPTWEGRAANRMRKQSPEEMKLAAQRIAAAWAKQK